MNWLNGYFLAFALIEAAMIGVAVAAIMTAKQGDNPTPRPRTTNPQ